MSASQTDWTGREDDGLLMPYGVLVLRRQGNQAVQDYLAEKQAAVDDAMAKLNTTEAAFRKALDAVRCLHALCTRGIPLPSKSMLASSLEIFSTPSVCLLQVNAKFDAAQAKVNAAAKAFDAVKKAADAKLDAAQRVLIGARTALTNAINAADSKIKQAQAGVDKVRLGVVLLGVLPMGDASRSSNTDLARAWPSTVLQANAAFAKAKDAVDKKLKDAMNGLNGLQTAKDKASKDCSHCFLHLCGA